MTQSVKGCVPTQSVGTITNRNPGEQVLFDNVMVVGISAPTAVAPLRIGMGSYPFGSVAPFLAEPQEKVPRRQQRVDGSDSP